MGKIKRFGNLISNVYLDYSVVAQMNWNHYKGKLSEYEEKKIVYVVPTKFWGEDHLCDWFVRKYKELEFREILQDRTSQYERIKKKLGFLGYPDFLARKESKWERLEVEPFSSSYQLHPSGYSEYLLCYDETKSFEHVITITLRDHVGCQEIINLHEIPEFLYLYDSEFKKNYDKRIMNFIRSKMLEE